MSIRTLIAQYGHDAIRDFEIAARLFARRNTDVVKLSVAENVLLFPELIQQIHQLEPLGSQDLMYTDAYGTEQMRERTAAMLNRTLGLGEPGLDARHVSGFSSTRAALLRLLEPLAGPGVPYFLVPTPCWQGFEWVLEDALGGRIERVASSPRSGFALSLSEIKQAYERALQRQGREPVALVLTNPGNPVGRNIPRPQLEEITAWLLDSTGMQLVSDEIYAHAQANGSATPFTSVLALDCARKPSAWGRIHVAWGFAKDFGLSGFRIGLYLCRDEARQQEARKNAQWSPFDSYNSVTMASSVLGAQGESGERLMTLFKERLSPLHESVRKTLEAEQIPFTDHTNAALFFWLDLRRWLDLVPADFECPQELLERELLSTSIDDRENRLREYLVCMARVDLAPGTQFLSSEPGFFRMCYTAAEPTKVLDGVRRMGAVLRNLG
ncbi:aminotransferase class I/II-fold pyridoxal phosphate-dependent enzyme [Hyalangium sp.]|uniref:aminotransferase class I/II-fold pyridoxal phosphate-dependent enzyme n=1 Tax=Hyalangium sp. TaxID=2028555 RepID=UPI002D4BEBA1|nr:aminotransferase class I/II-fold pyridoxal phosphate-dependent enzyme [Hyalangium sp.]HYH98038.1 aminotransferase class I/II-fold pyridoxal phosphate-dependent enzyme [Hyalangium sp.]